MGILVIDSTSARTLPLLDKLFIDGENTKLESIVTQTEGAPLRRLIRAAISRHRFLGGEVDETGDSVVRQLAAIMESMIELNLVQNSSNAESRIDQALDSLSDAALRVMLGLSLARYNVYDRF
jgi:hypothetical protein